MLFHARLDKVVVQEVGKELVVYDQERHRAHRLNPTAALVWQHCDGETSISDMATLLQTELHLPADEEVVWLALNRLDHAHLLRESVMRPMDTTMVARRRLIQRLGLAAGLALILPVVESIVAPILAMAQPNKSHKKEVCVCYCPPGEFCPQGGKITLFSRQTCGSCSTLCDLQCGSTDLDQVVCDCRQE